jgi:hypothetical protein
MDNLALAHDWILLLDADEIVSPELADEIARVIRQSRSNGHYIRLQMHFLGRHLQHCGADFWKLALFRRGAGRFECRLEQQDTSMCDMEVHEHVIIDGAATRLRNPLIHQNFESFSRYIQKHDEYSNWEARVWLAAEQPGQLKPSLLGNQAQRRRWLKKKLFALPGSPVALFLYRYIFRLGFLDGVPGLIYCAMQAIQLFQVKAKMFEIRSQACPRLPQETSI